MYLENPEGRLSSKYLLSVVSLWLVPVAAVGLGVLDPVWSPSLDLALGLGLLVLAAARPMRWKVGRLAALGAIAAVGGGLVLHGADSASHGGGVRLAILFFALSVLSIGSSTRLSGMALGVGFAVWLFEAFCDGFGIGPAAQGNEVYVIALGLIIPSLLLQQRHVFVVKLIISRRATGVRTRRLIAFAIGVPFAFGAALFHIFGVPHREVPIEAMMLVGISLSLLVAVLQNAKAAEQVELHHKQREALLLRQANTDALTGLPNRQGTCKYLASAWQRYTKNGQNAAVILFDLDHFKSINDTFGHDVGDMVLKAISAALTPNTRSGDLVGRWGGEEFLCVLPNVNPTEFEVVGERLRSSIEGLTIPLSKKVGQPCLVSASFGIAQFSATDRDAQDVVQRADAALYMSKRSGRNCVSVDAGAKPKQIKKPLVLQSAWTASALVPDSLT